MISEYVNRNPEPCCSPIAGKRSARFDHKAVKIFFTICGFVCIIIIAFMIIFLISTGIRFFTVRSFQDLFLGVWNPELELQPNPETTLYFNIIPLLYGSFSITLTSMIIALPLGISTAIFIAEIAPFKIRMYLKTAIELLAGIPSVVIGYFGLMVVNKFVRDNFDVAGASLLSGSIILGMMCLPIIITVSEDAISVVPKEYKEASYAMGATRWETISKVTVPSAFSGITVSIILAFGRAIGETMAVIMVVGNNPSIPEPIYNLLRPIYTLTGALGIEIKEVDVNTPWYFALFLLGTILLLIAITTNLTARKIMKKMNQKFCPTETPKKSLFNKRKQKIPKECKEYKKPSLRFKFRLPPKVSSTLKIGIIIVVALVIFEIVSFNFGLTRSIIGLCLIVAAGLLIKISEKKNRQRVVFVIISIGVGVVIFLLGILIIDIFQRGLEVISPEFLTGENWDSGRQGGIKPQIFGTLYLVIGTILVAFPIGLAAGIYLAEYTKDSKLKHIVDTGIDNLSGTPSIIFGMFGLLFFCNFFKLGVSLLAGILTMALMVLPTIIRTTENALRQVPFSLREGSYAMGASKWYTIRKVIIPTARPQIMTGIILSMGRVAGETAPILYTAAVFLQPFQSLPLLDQPIQTLSYHIYMLSMSIYGGRPMAGGSSLVLLVMVMILFFLASWIRTKMKYK